MSGVNPKKHNVPNRLSPKMTTPVAEFWCCTQGKVEKFSHMWTINNFSFCCHEMKQLESPTFSTKDKSKWRLKIYFGDHDGSKYVSMFLHLVSCNKSKVKARYKFSSVTATGENIEFGESVNSQDGIENFKNIMCMEYFLDATKDSLIDNKLKIHCKGIILTDVINICWPQHTVQFKVECRQYDILGLLFENEKFSDVTLTACGKNFQAHKAILAAQSPVFSAMFVHDMEERKKNHVNITDMDHEVLREMLRFIYTGKAENLEKMADVLLVAAEKYALGRLKVICQKVLCSSLTIDNAVTRLIFADLYSADQLKLQTINFIITHATHVTATVDFKSLIISHPNLIVEAFKVATQRFQSLILCGEDE